MAVQEISVYITLDQYGQTEIQVDQPWAGVHSGSPILWDFHCVDTRANWAEIEFQPGSNFFKGRGNAHATRRYTQLNGGHGEILGTAPELLPANGQPKSANAKYWVRVFSDLPTNYPPAQATQLKELDPNIIVCDP
jgi:hypothetical protein